MSATDFTDAFVLPAGVIHLDSAAQGPRLACVQAAAHAALEASARPWQLGQQQWQDQREQLRALAATLLFDGDGDGVAMLPSATHGIAIAATNLPLAAGEAVLVLEGEFPAVVLPWQQRCAQVGARLAVASVGEDEDWTQAVLRTLDADPAIRIAALPQCFWRDGRRLDLDVVAAALARRGIALVLDLSQSLGTGPLALGRWQPQFVVAVGHKWLLGPQGLAWLWVAPAWRNRGEPIAPHWLARQEPQVWQWNGTTVAPFRAGARRHDAGGIADPMRLAMAAAALQQLQAWTLPRVAAELAERGHVLRQALELAGVAYAGQHDASGPPAPMLAIAPAAERVEALATQLARNGVVCSQRQGVFRLAPHLAVTPARLQQVASWIAAALD